MQNCLILLAQEVDKLRARGSGADFGNYPSGAVTGAEMLPRKCPTCGQPIDPDDPTKITGIEQQDLRAFGPGHDYVDGMHPDFHAECFPEGDDGWRRADLRRRGPRPPNANRLQTSAADRPDSPGRATMEVWRNPLLIRTIPNRPIRAIMEPGGFSVRKPGFESP